MTYDVAVWKEAGQLSDAEATAEFKRRMDQLDEGRDAGAPIAPEMTELARQLTERFPQEPPPWEDLWDSIDGDFLYLTMSYDEGPAVEEFLVQTAPNLGLVVYSPIPESLLRPPPPAPH